MALVEAWDVRGIRLIPEPNRFMLVPLIVAEQAERNAKQRPCVKSFCGGEPELIDRLLYVMLMLGMSSYRQSSIYQSSNTSATALSWDMLNIYRQCWVWHATGLVKVLLRILRHSCSAQPLRHDCRWITLILECHRGRLRLRAGKRGTDGEMRLARRFEQIRVD